MKKLNVIPTLTLFVSAILIVTSCDSGNHDVGENSVDTTQVVTEEVEENINPEVEELPLNEGWKTVASDVYAFQYPAGWSIEQEAGEANFVLTTDLYSEDQTFNDNLNLMTVAGDAEKLDIESEVYMNTYKEQVKAQLGFDEYISSGMESENGQSFYKLEYPFEQGGSNLVLQQRYYKGKKIDYVLTYASDKSSYKKNKVAVEKAMDSFTLKR